MNSEKKQILEVKKNNYEIKENDKKLDFINKSYFYLIIIIFVIINLLANIFLIFENKNNKALINELFLYYKNFNYENETIFNNKDSNIYKNKDMIGYKYPEIMFNTIKKNLHNHWLFSSLNQLIDQLEIKLIYLEKEINVTKLNSFYTTRTLYLEKKGIEYDDSNITELHNIISWLVIHKSTQLKGIDSDKYLSCEYVKMKLGENLCPHRIGVYNSYDEINFEELLKKGNVMLKVSNGCNDNVFIFKNTKYDIDKLREKVKYSFYRNYASIVPEFFHFFSKKRIVIEKIFIPLTDLYEFKIIIVNNKIKIIYVRVNYNNTINFFYYDSNFNLLSNETRHFFNISKFDKNILAKLKNYAIKLSEDFPNFIRVDLYIFQNKIYLSELTFDSNNGEPFLRDNKIIINTAKFWKRIDY